MRGVRMNMARVLLDSVEQRVQEVKALLTFLPLFSADAKGEPMKLLIRGFLPRVFLRERSLHACLPVGLPALRKGEGRAGRTPSVSATLARRGLSPLVWDYSTFALSSRLPPFRVTTCTVADRLWIGACTMMHGATEP